VSKAQLTDSLRDAFRIYARNGRWGTCGGCPHDEEGNAYPEFCDFTARYDHNMTAAELADAVRRYQPQPEVVA
jgi:hypothetical protein